MGYIDIENMEFFAYHGHYDEEKLTGCKFLVDLRIETDLSTAAQTDNLKDTLDYQYLYRLVDKIMKEKLNLIEHIAGKIITKISSVSDDIVRVSVKVSKLNPPLGGKVEKVSVTLSN
jgi:dihydroneopterin aldolase